MKTRSAAFLAMALAGAGVAAFWGAPRSVAMPNVSITVTSAPTTADDPETENVDESKNATTFTVVVSGLGENEKWKDIHLGAPPKRRFPKYAGGTSPTVPVTPTGGGSAQDWTGANSGDEVSVYANGAAGFGNGTFTFTLDWNDNNAQKGTVRNLSWTVTKNGGKTYGDGDIVPPDTGGGTPTGPVLKLSANSGDPLVLSASGGTWPFAIECDTAFEGWDYQIYTSTQLAPDFDDALGIGIRNTTHAVPSGWNLTFSNFTGEINASGGATYPPSIGVPEPSPVSGVHFYLVFALKDGSDVFLSSVPIQVSIE